MTRWKKYHQPFYLAFLPSMSISSPFILLVFDFLHCVGRPPGPAAGLLGRNSSGALQIRIMQSLSHLFSDGFPGFLGVDDFPDCGVPLRGFPFAPPSRPHAPFVSCAVKRALFSQDRPHEPSGRRSGFPVPFFITRAFLWVAPLSVSSVDLFFCSLRFASFLALFLTWSLLSWLPD